MSSMLRDFALLGHLDSFKRYEWFFQRLREEGRSPIDPDQLKVYLDGMPASRAGEIPPFIDPRGNTLRGCYIDCYFDPARLSDMSYQRRAIRKVRSACELASKLPVRVAALGGFTSILGELSAEPISRIGDTVFTTGNTLTCWAILNGAFSVAKRLGIDPSQARVMVLGAAGDIGSGCSRWLNGRVRNLYLVGRTTGRVQKFAETLPKTRTIVTSTDDYTPFAAEADIVICVASTLKGQFNAELFPKHAVVADAGYPKNVVAHEQGGGPWVFHSGMMRLPLRIGTDPEWLVSEVYPRENAIHGCLGEGILLAMSRRYEPYSVGRGNITPERIEEIGALALDWGFGLAEPFNAHGLLFPSTPATAGVEAAAQSL